MRKLFIASVIALVSPLFIMSGCTETYTIHINCHSDANNPVPNNARIFVAVEPNAENPLFDKEVRTKIQKLLLKENYEVVNDSGAAEYQLSYHFGSAPRETTSYVRKESYSGMHGFRGPGAYTPYLETIMDQWIQLKLYHADKVVWDGRAQTMQQYTGERKIVDFLLTGVFEFFGRDTNGEQYMGIKEDDPRVIELDSYVQ